MYVRTCDRGNAADGTRVRVRGYGRPDARFLEEVGTVPSLRVWSTGTRDVKAGLFFARDGRSVKFALHLPGITMETFEKVEFYRGEADVLSRLGETSIVSSARELPRDVDLVFSWWWDRSFPAAVVARLLRLPLVVTGAGALGAPYQGRARTMAKGVLSRSTAEMAALNLAISGCEEDRLRFLQFPRLHRLPLAVDVDYFSPPPQLERDAHLLLTVGHLNSLSVERKGILRAVESLAGARDRLARLVIVGEDQGAQRHVAGHARRLGVLDRVEFCGSLDRESKRELLWSAGAYLQLSSWEGFGMAVAEAMAAGCPVIVTRAGSLPEITASTAFASVDTPEEAAEAITKMSSSADELRAASEQGRDHARREFAYSVRGQRLADLLELVK